MSTDSAIVRDAFIVLRLTYKDSKDKESFYKEKKKCTFVCIWIYCLMTNVEEPQQSEPDVL